MRIYNQLNRYSLPKADLVITVCKPFAETLESTGVKRDRLRVLPNSIEERSAPQRAFRQPCSILAVGRFSREKGHADLIDAFAALPSTCRLVLVGDGPERSRLEKKVREHNLTERVTMTGHQADPFRYYESADLFVLPSWSEGSPNVLLEAMRAGLPVVSTSVGGVPEMVEDGVDGLLVPPRNSPALAAAINKIVSNPAHADSLGANAARATANFSPAKYRESLIAIYRQAARPIS